MDLLEARYARGGPTGAEDLDHQEACAAKGQQVDGGAGDDLVRLEGDAHERVDQGEDQPRREAEAKANEGATREEGPNDPGEGGDEHQALEPDVDHPASLAEHAA
jgi:hypothetical protein